MQDKIKGEKQAWKEWNKSGDYSKKQVCKIAKRESHESSSYFTM